MLNAFSDDESTTSSNADRPDSPDVRYPQLHQEATCYPKTELPKEEEVMVCHMSYHQYNRQYQNTANTSNYEPPIHIVNDPASLPNYAACQYSPESGTLQNPKQSGPINYGVLNVIQEGRWNLTRPDYAILPSNSKIEPPHYWIPPPTYGHSTVNSGESDSIIRMSVEEEANPLLKGLNRCHSCKRRFTARRKTNYWAILFLLIVAFCLILSLFPWGILSLVALGCIPSQINKPTCKKCQKKCC